MRVPHPRRPPRRIFAARVGEPLAPRTMILLDPDLDSHPAPKPTSASLSSRPLPSTRALTRFLAEAQAAVHLRGRVTVLLTTDATLRDLNRRFRGKNKPTDVLSFPATAPASGRKKIAGDLAISVETARRQAAEQGHSLATELKVLILHGLLHLTGYDHETDTGRMRCRERDLRARLGLPQGLIERASRREAERTAGCPILSRSSRKGGKARTPSRGRVSTR